jgi:hypothetical protein
MTALAQEEARQEDGRWLRRLCDLAHGWVESSPADYPIAQTGAYVDLIFAFGLARLGVRDYSRELYASADEALSRQDDAHRLLLQAYTYRIRQAFDGSVSGPLPAALQETLAGMERLLLYVVDRLRKHSRILEPDQRTYPYRNWGARISAFERALCELSELQEPHPIIQSVRDLLERAGRGKYRDEARARVLVGALNKAPRVHAEFGRDVLQQALTTTYKAYPPPTDGAAVLEHVLFLESALFVVAHFQLRELLEPCVARTQELFRRLAQARTLWSVDGLIRQCIRTFGRLQMADELDQFLCATANLILQGQPVEERDFREPAHGPAELRSLLCLAEGWYSFGWDTLAEPVVKIAWALLAQDDLPAREQTELACSYAGAVGQAPTEQARRRLEQLFRELRGIRDTYTTATHFSVSQLDVVESVVLAAVENPAVSPAPATPP